VESAGDSAGGPSALETLTAENGPPLCGPERNGRFAPALRANGRGFDAIRASAPVGVRLSFGFTSLAAFRLVSEFLVVVKLLLARGEREIVSAVHALERTVLKFGHFGAILKNGSEARAGRFACWWLFDFPATLLPVSFTGKSCFNPLFFSRLQIERMPFNFFDDVFLLYFPFEAAKGIFECFALLEPDFSQY
jgi:hypothetical protein